MIGQSARVPINMAQLAKAALGFRVHSGWAALVAIVGPPGAPSILIRKRIEISDPKISGSKQPYHAAEQLSLQDAERVIAACAASSSRLALEAVKVAIQEASKKSYDIVAAGVLTGSGKPLPPLEKILMSHPLLHTAEGEFFRRMIAQACRSCGLATREVNEKSLPAQCPAVLGIPEDLVQQNLARMGKGIGPPWRQDEKLASLVAWMALAADALPCLANTRL
jgi:hypothetical protein